MKDAGSPHVALTKMCELHSIAMPRDGDLAEQFRRAFPSADYAEDVGARRMVGKKGTYADSNARIY
jgi:hypothetical protein